MSLLFFISLGWRSNNKPSKEWRCLMLLLKKKPLYLKRRRRRRRRRRRTGNRNRRHINLEGGGQQCGGWCFKWVEGIKVRMLGVLVFQGMKMKLPVSFQEWICAVRVEPPNCKELSYLNILIHVGMRACARTHTHTHTHGFSQWPLRRSLQINQQAYWIK